MNATDLALAVTERLSELAATQRESAVEMGLSIESTGVVDAERDGDCVVLVPIGVSGARRSALRGALELAAGMAVRAGFTPSVESTARGAVLRFI